MRQRGRSIRRSQRASQRSDDTFKSDSDTLSYSISDPDRFFDDGEDRAAARLSRKSNHVSPAISASAPATAANPPPPPHEIDFDELSAMDVPAVNTGTSWQSILGEDEGSHVSCTVHFEYCDTEWIAATDPQVTVSTPPSPQTPEKSSIDKKVSSAASRIMARAAGQWREAAGFKRDSQKSGKSNTSAGSGDGTLAWDVRQHLSPRAELRRSSSARRAWRPLACMMTSTMSRSFSFWPDSRS